MKLSHGIGGIPEVIKGFAFNSFLLFYYSQILGLRPTHAAIAIAITTLVDGLVDPFIGSWSDNLRSRLGRRHPLMYAAAIPLGVGLALVFMPPAGLGEAGLFSWLLATTIATHVAISLYSTPWTALMTELSDDYTERTTVVTWCFAVGWAGGVAFAWAAWTLILPDTQAFPNGQLNPAGYPLLGLVAGLAASATALFSARLTQRELPFLLQPIGVRPDPGMRDLIAELRQMLSNRDFLVLFLAALLAAVVGGTAAALQLYVQTYFWGLGSAALKWFVLAVIGAAAAFALVGPLQRRFDKKWVMIGCFALSIVNGAAIVAARLMALLPGNESPLLLPILLVNTVTGTLLTTLLGIMFVSMLADSLDGQELQTGRRQEGMFAAGLSFSTKATTGLGVLVSGVLLEQAIGWPAAGAMPTAAQIHDLGLVAGLLVPLLYLVPLAICCCYRIDRAGHQAIRTALARRRLDVLQPDKQQATPRI